MRIDSRFSFLALIIGLALIASGCDAFGSSDDEPEVEGEYTFSTLLGNAEVDFEGNITQSGTRLSGTGTTSFTFQFDDGTSQSVNVPSSIGWWADYVLVVGTVRSSFSVDHT